MTAEPICGVEAASCICVEAPDHTDSHRCSCGGSWAYADDGTFIPGSWPGSASFDEEVTGVEPRE